MHGYGLCLWILREFEQAEQVFKRILYFNPTDDQGIRYLLDDVCDRKNWKDLREGNSRK